MGTDSSDAKHIDAQFMETHCTHTQHMEAQKKPLSMWKLTIMTHIKLNLTIMTL
jgi:hypothetical protein